MALNPESPITTKGRALKLLLTLLSRLSLSANHRLGAAIGWLFYRLPNRNQRVAKVNIARCFPKLTPVEQNQQVLAHLKHSGKTLTELAYFWGRSAQSGLDQIRQVHGGSYFQDAIDQGKGFLLAAPHLGAWELLCQYFSSKTECAILYREPRDPGIEAVITQARSRVGAELIKADARGVRRLFRAAKAGKPIGILPDQQPKRGSGEFVPFFGYQALTMVLLSRLAQMDERPVLFGFAQRLPKGAGFDLHFLPAPAEIRSKEMQTSLIALNQMVEHCVRLAPEQYQWGYKRFGIRPADEAAFY